MQSPIVGPTFINGTPLMGLLVGRAWMQNLGRSMCGPGLDQGIRSSKPSSVRPACNLDIKLCKELQKSRIWEGWGLTFMACVRFRLDMGLCLLS